MANICLNLFNLTCRGNYSLRHYCSIFIGSLLLRRLAPTSFVFHSDFRRQQDNNQKKHSLPPSPYIMAFGFAVLTFLFLPITHCLGFGGWVKVRDLLPVTFGTCCSLAASLCWSSHIPKNADVYVMCNICLSVLISLCNYVICMYTS